MFSILVSGSGVAWETDQLMRMDSGRFKEFSGVEAQSISSHNPDSLALLESVPALLLYEDGTPRAATDEVRYGNVHDIQSVEGEMRFRFSELERFSRSTFREFATRLGINDHIEHHRTHWAVKDGGIPSEMMDRLRRTYDVALSFAGADRAFVEQVATVLRKSGVRVFYDSFEEVALWGQNLGEFLQDLYERRARYCVIFISADYANREWTRHERRAALDRAIRDRRQYILPYRFDDTGLEGLSPSLAYISRRTPTELATLILQKLGRTT